MSAAQPLYRQVATRIETMIQGGTFAVGDRIPSVRQLSRQLDVSVTTVVEAYRLLEDRRLVEARPAVRLLRPRLRSPPRLSPRRTESAAAGTPPEISDLVLRFLRGAQTRGVLALGAAVPDPAYLPVQRLNRLLVQSVRQQPSASQSYDAVAGLEQLRVQIGRRALDAGCSLSPDDILTTSGAQAAVHLCLQATTLPGDTVAVESPTYYGLLEALESLHLRAVEVATHPRDGVDLDELVRVFEREKISACVFSPSFGNPLGHCMPDAARRRLVEELTRPPDPPDRGRCLRRVAVRVAPSPGGEVVRYRRTRAALLELLEERRPGLPDRMDRARSLPRSGRETQVRVVGGHSDAHPDGARRIPRRGRIRPDPAPAAP